MTYYAFKRDTELYAVINGNQHNIDTNDASFSQKLDEKLTEQKTIQLSELFGDIKVNAYLPGNFSINVPAIREPDFEALFSAGIEVQTFDLYVRTKKTTFHLEYCVITQMQFQFEPNSPIRVGISGDVRKVTRVGDQSYAIPGTVVARTGRTYNLPTTAVVTHFGVPTLEGLTSVTVTLQNNIEWVPYETLDELCHDGSIASYPTDFTLKKRILSGNSTSYRLDELGFVVGDPLYIQIGQEVNGTVYGFEFDLPEVVYTKRVNPGDIFTFSYDWRLTHNPAHLSELITYITDQAGDARAILDYWGEAILDSDGQPILDSF